MAKYHRILASYPLPGGGWSSLHWCNIQRDDTGRLHVRVSEASPEGPMPSTKSFKEIDEVSATKLRVIDFTDKDNPIYCLGVKEDQKPLYSFIYTPTHNTWTAMEWNETDEDDPWAQKDGVQRTIQAATFYHKSAPIVNKKLTWIPPQDDDRLVLCKEDYYNTVADEPMLERFSQQYTAWRDAKKAKAKDQQAAKERIAAEWKKQQAVHIDSNHIISKLNKVQAFKVNQALSAYILQLKQVSPTQASYCMALKIALKHCPFDGENVALNLEQKNNLRLFHGDFLYHSKIGIPGLENFYQDDFRAVDEQPTRENVHNFIMSCIFEELKKYDPDIDAVELVEHYREECPKSYIGKQLGAIKVKGPICILDEDNDDIDYTANQSIARVLDNQDVERCSQLMKHDFNLSKIVRNPIVLQHRNRLWFFQVLIEKLLLDADEETSKNIVTRIFDCIHTEERVYILRAMDLDVLRPFIEFHNGLETLRQYGCHMIDALIPRLPANNQLFLAQLSSTINRIDGAHHAIIEKATSVKNSLIDLINAGDAVEVRGLLRQTNALLRAAPADRPALIEAYKETANRAAGRPNVFWKTLGIAMMALGTVMTALGVAGLFSGIGIALGVGGVVGGAALFATGCTLFGRNRQQGLSKRLQTLAESVERNPGGLFP